MTASAQERLGWYDLDAMLREIRDDETLGGDKEQRISQAEIMRQVTMRRQSRRRRGGSKK